MAKGRRSIWDFFHGLLAFHFRYRLAENGLRHCIQQILMLPCVPSIGETAVARTSSPLAFAQAVTVSSACLRKVSLSTMPFLPPEAFADFELRGLTSSTTCAPGAADARDDGNHGMSTR